MKRIWYARNGLLTAFVLGETEIEARATAFALWNDDPDDVRDVTEPFTVLVGPLITHLRERVPARDGSGSLFRFTDPVQAIRRWLGDVAAEETICPTCSQPTAIAASRAFEQLKVELRGALDRITTLEQELAVAQEPR